MMDFSSMKMFDFYWKALSWAAAGERRRDRPDMVLESRVAVLTLECVFD
jgi:hypothetical protein